MQSGVQFKLNQIICCSVSYNLVTKMVQTLFVETIFFVGKKTNINNKHNKKLL